MGCDRQTLPHTDFSMEYVVCVKWDRKMHFQKDPVLNHLGYKESNLEGNRAVDWWLKILTGNVEKVDVWPRCTKKAIFYFKRVWGWLVWNTGRGVGKNTSRKEQEKVTMTCSCHNVWKPKIGRWISPVCISHRAVMRTNKGRQTDQFQLLDSLLFGWFSYSASNPECLCNWDVDYSFPTDVQDYLL